MKWIVLLSLVWAAPEGHVETKESKKTKTPFIRVVESPAFVQQGRDEKETPAKAGQSLVEKASFRTGRGGQMRVQVAPNFEIVLNPDSHMEFPGIQWENGEVPSVELAEGELRWISEGGENTTTLVSKMFSLKPGNGHFLFRVEPQVPRATVLVYRGSLEFSATNAEESRLVKEGEKVSFNGMLENGEIAADLLLRGRKIPRGKLGPAEKMSEAEWGAVRAEEKRKADLEAQKKEAARKKAQTEKVAGLICVNPGAKLNQCVWQCRGGVPKRPGCEGGLCVRKRCNANGVWSEETKVVGDDDRSKCKPEPTVANCDY